MLNNSTEDESYFNNKRGNTNTSITDLYDSLKKSSSIYDENDLEGDNTSSSDEILSSNDKINKNGQIINGNHIVFGKSMLSDFYTREQSKYISSPRDISKPLNKKMPIKKKLKKLVKKAKKTGSYRKKMARGSNDKVSHENDIDSSEEENDEEVEEDYIQIKNRFRSNSNSINSNSGSKNNSRNNSKNNSKNNSRNNSRKNSKSIDSLASLDDSDSEDRKVIKNSIMSPNEIKSRLERIDERIYKMESEDSIEDDHKEVGKHNNHNHKENNHKDDKEDNNHNKSKDNLQMDHKNNDHINHNNNHIEDHKENDHHNDHSSNINNNNLHFKPNNVILSPQSPSQKRFTPTKKKTSKKSSNKSPKATRKEIKVKRLLSMRVEKDYETPKGIYGDHILDLKSMKSRSGSNLIKNINTNGDKSSKVDNNKNKSSSHDNINNNHHTTTPSKDKIPLKLIIKKDRLAEEDRQVQTERSSSGIKSSETNLKARKTSGSGGSKKTSEKNVRIQDEGKKKKEENKIISSPVNLRSSQIKKLDQTSSVELKRKFSAKKIKKTSMSCNNIPEDIIIKNKIPSMSLPEKELKDSLREPEENPEKRSSFLKILNESKDNPFVGDDSVDMYDFLNTSRPPSNSMNQIYSCPMRKKKEKETKEMKEQKKKQKLKDSHISKMVELLIKSTINEDEILSGLENKKLVKMWIADEVEPLVVDGPHPEDNSCTLPDNLPDNVHCISVSTYPFLPMKPQREGSPICDSYKVCLYQSGLTFLTICDGCNWGKGPRDAAITAKKTFCDYIEKNVKSLKDIKKTAKILIRAVYMSHFKIIEDKQDIWEAGTTTFLGGILTQEQQKEDSFIFMFISVGDCKALVYDGKRVRDVTLGNRQNASNPCDPGGRIGPYVKEGLPDMRNLKVDYCTLKQGEYLMLVSDGVSDNFDPEQLGYSPSEIGIKDVQDDNWKMVDKLVAIEAKAKWSNHKMEEVLNKATFPFMSKNLIAPSKVLSHAIVRHCTDSTYNGRNWMENNPTLPLPIDYKNYPGKMDHTSVVVMRLDESFSFKKYSKKNFFNNTHLRRSYNLNHNNN
eukprot:TRINITY_DN7201_c0_g1_i1.p1 TRINITY_DN7201_c0_g1~~TRINITY_DN7201_c0_g1_i1.p1  ORF type:complete len:1068 (-),score=372.72 TRINITY_DN7201_c0_g1_i1:14-3217(-)